MAGDVQAMFDAIGSSVPHIQAGALRAIGVSATTRLRVLPDVPPIADVVPGYLVTGWLGFGAPKGTPSEIVERLNREINVAMTNPMVKTRMAELGSEIFTGSPGDFGKLVAEETEKWAKVVRFAGLKAD
jgi:tripartite-type tricarboxylate transporter receptor subunit TctC